MREKPCDTTTGWRRRWVVRVVLEVGEEEGAGREAVPAAEAGRAEEGADLEVVGEGRSRCFGVCRISDCNLYAIFQFVRFQLELDQSDQKYSGRDAIPIDCSPTRLWRSVVDVRVTDPIRLTGHELETRPYMLGGELRLLCNCHLWSRDFGKRNWL